MPEVPSGSSFEADLRALREERGLSIADIERATRVPADVVRRFESGVLMQDPDYSAVYLRAFVKAYAEALDLSTARVHEAFEASRKGAYAGTLAPTHEADEIEAATEANTDASAATADTATADTATADTATADTAKTTVSTPTKKGAAPHTSASPASPVETDKRGARSSDTLPTPAATSASESTSRAAETAPMVEALATKPAPDTATATPQPPRRGSAPSTLSSSNQSWGLVVGIAVLSVLALSVVFWLIFRNPTPDLEPVAAAPVVDTTAVPDSAAAARPARPPTPQVGDSIRVTLIAAEGPLQNFRVQATPDIRRPYWVEQGSEVTFTSLTEVVVWGNETASGWRIDSEAQLRIEGLTYAPADGAVQRFTRARAQAVVDSLHRAQHGD
ncbi:MAG: helix-turn-helix domain-containing protein [Bacteroidota bacterium]